MAEPEVATGSCLCGDVNFEFELPSKWCAHCYCPLCRKAHGAGFVTWVGVDAAGFKLTKGREKLSRYRSSAEAERRFCGTCGASMFFESAKWPGEVHIAMGCVDTNIDRAPEANAFTDNKAHWIALQEIKSAGG